MSKLSYIRVAVGRGIPKTCLFWTLWRDRQH